MEEFNIGAQIKAVLESKGMTVTEFAKRINKSRENCYSIFARKTIDTGLLQTISTVLAHDFFMQFSSSYHQMSEETQKLRDENTILKEYYSLLKGKEWGENRFSLMATPSINLSFSFFLNYREKLGGWIFIGIIL